MLASRCRQKAAATRYNPLWQHGFGSDANSSPDDQGAILVLPGYPCIRRLDRGEEEDHPLTLVAGRRG